MSRGDPACAAAWGWHCCPPKPSRADASPILISRLFWPLHTAVGGVCDGSWAGLGAELFAWRQWLLVTREGWVKRNGLGTVPGVGLAVPGLRAGQDLALWSPFCLWLQLCVCGYLLPQTFIEHKRSGDVGQAAQSCQRAPSNKCFPWRCLLPQAVPERSCGVCSWPRGEGRTGCS